MTVIWEFLLYVCLPIGVLATIEYNLRSRYFPILERKLDKRARRDC
jgi:hypothetical protein